MFQTRCGLFKALLRSASMWLVLLFCLFEPVDVWGRAGGGGGFSGGGGGFSGGGGGFSGGGGGFSGGGFSGGGGGGEPNVFVVLSVVMIMIGLGVSQVVQTMSGRDKSRSTRVRGRTRPSTHLHVLGKVERVDPAFDGAAFIENFKHAFVRIQEAWMHQDMAAVEHFVTDGISEKFSVQFREQRVQGYREQLDQIEIHEVGLARFESTGLFDVLSVEVVASMVDQRLSSETGKRISGGSSPESFSEFWSFVRRRGAQSDESQGSLLAGACPNCGSQVNLNQFGKCDTCDSLVRSGAYDWVLSEITQADAWRAESNDQPRTMARQYRQQHDPQFSAQQLEDRAAVIFARKGMADLSGQLDPLRKMATAAFCAAYQVPSSRRFRGDCSVGSLDLLGMVTEAEQHYALLELNWAGRKFTRLEGGGVSSTQEWKRYRSLMVLSRRADVRSNAQSAMQSAHCASCGAPEEDLAADTCSFCSEVTNTGKYDWVLLEFAAHHSVEALRWRARLAKPKSGEGTEVAAAMAAAAEAAHQRAAISSSECLMWAIGVLAEDAQLDDQERRSIGQLADKQRIAPSLVEGWFRDALGGDLDRPETSDRELTASWLKQMVEVAVADGKLEPAEHDLLSQLASSLKMSNYDLNLAIRKEGFGRTV